jgi:hypothetical protein
MPEKATQRARLPTDIARFHTESTQDDHPAVKLDIAGVVKAFTGNGMSLKTGFSTPVRIQRIAQYRGRQV